MPGFDMHKEDRPVTLAHERWKVIQTGVLIKKAMNWQ